jgi:hypothetical protein
MNKKERFNPYKIVILLLLCLIIVIIAEMVYATAPNPGHNFSAIGGGVAQGDLLYGSAADTLSALAKDINETRYLSNTGTNNNPAWAQVDLTNGVFGVLAAANGGTDSAYFSVTGPTTSAKVFTFPDANATVLTTNAAVTVAQGGTGVATLGDAGVLIGNGTGAVQVTSAGTSGQVLTSNGAGVDPTFQSPTGGDDARVKLDALGSGEQFDTTANSATMTEVTALSQTLAAGTYTFRYYVIYRSNDATDGIRLSVNYSGTNGAFVWRWCWTDAIATASSAAADQDAIIAAGQVNGCHASRAESTTTRGTTISADTANADMMATIEGVFIATGAGDLELWAGNEAAGVGDINSIMPGTSVEIHKTAN